MKKILVVEDDQVTGTALAMHLKTCGYSVTLTPDAVSAVEAALKLMPDLILLDISMPAGSGFTVAQRIQKLLPIETPMIFLTASKDPNLRERAMEMGAAAFFRKPVELENIVGAIQLALAGVPMAAAQHVYII